MRVADTHLVLRMLCYSVRGSVGNDKSGDQSVGITALAEQT